MFCVQGICRLSAKYGQFVFHLRCQSILLVSKSVRLEFIIEIDNKDNQPLQITSVNFLQKEKYLVTDLMVNQNYTITAGDKKLKKPSYDIVNFKNEITYNLPILKLENEEVIVKTKSATVKNIPFYEKPWFMWLSIGFVGLIILLFTVSLLKKTNEMS
ncbi:hypothetical protein MNBD_BACTEROID03-2277 [hydrothermal vent metagenome]|uniref:Uncharacterized protein n=1 Tax=hydrothermal vent metagenome TaxID=652676 RepID=A0A3B0T0V4_9ZZZZ